MPIVESTPLFARAIGEVTDVVSKEMYTFWDNDEQLTLRPEGTAGCVRAAIEHGWIYNNEQRLWYMGPMFRHERPQKGRYRQFHQAGVEVFGIATPEIDAELIILTARCWKALGIDQHDFSSIKFDWFIRSTCKLSFCISGFLRKSPRFNERRRERNVL